MHHSAMHYTKASVSIVRNRNNLWWWCCCVVVSWLTGLGGPNGYWNTVKQQLPTGSGGKRHENYANSVLFIHSRVTAIHLTTPATPPGCQDHTTTTTTTTTITITTAPLQTTTRCQDHIIYSRLGGGGGLGGVVWHCFLTLTLAGVGGSDSCCHERESRQ